jgi:hypothetical protein
MLEGVHKKSRAWGGFPFTVFFVALGNGVPGKKVSGVEGEVEEST